MTKTKLTPPVPNPLKMKTEDSSDDEDPPVPLVATFKTEDSSEGSFVTSRPGAFLLYLDDQLDPIVFDSVRELADWTDDFEMLYDMTTHWRDPGRIDPVAVTDAVGIWSELTEKYPGDMIPLAINRRMRLICRHHSIPIPL